MSNVINAVIQIAAFNAEKQILKSVISAKCALGLEASNDRSVLENLRYEGATVVSSVRIAGWIELPMYDDQPIDFASFRVTTEKKLSIVPQSLENAKHMMQSQFLLDTWYGVDGYVQPQDPDEFVDTGMTRVELIDNLGNVVAQAAVSFEGEVKWDESIHMNEADIADTLQKAGELESQASYEVAMADNFDTARSLREQASGLRRKVSIAQNVMRLAA